MTIEEAVQAARTNVPVVYENQMEGPVLYLRISAIRKDFALREDVRRGKASDRYLLELIPMNGANSVTSVLPERVREATPEELADVRQYRYRAKMPEVRPELMCEEVKARAR